MAGIDPRLYGGAPLEPELQRSFPGVAVQPAPDVPVAKQGQGTLAEQQGISAVQEANRERAGFLAAAGGAMHVSLTADLIHAYTKPSFAVQDGFQVGDAITALPIAFSADELDWVKSAGSPEELHWKVGRIQDTRDAMRAAGDNGYGAFLGAIADPAYLAADVLSAGAASSLRLGRLGAAGLGAATVATGLQVAQTSRPVSNIEQVFGVAAGSLGAAMIYKGGKAVLRDPLFPEAELADAVAGATQATGRRVIRPAEYADGKLVREAEYAAVQDSTDVAEAAAHAEQHTASLAQRIGQSVQWSLHRSLSNFGDVGKRVADLLVDNNADLGVHSAESLRRAELAPLRNMQTQYEDLLQGVLKGRGVGLWQRINPFTARTARDAQRSLEKDLHLELLRRDQLTRQGVEVRFDGVDKQIKAMADKVDELHRTTLQQLKAAGVEGADEIVERAGWLHRQWSVSGMENSISRLTKRGMSEGAARARVTKLVAQSLRRGNGWDAELSSDIAGAIVDRTFRKGYLEDAAFNSTQTKGTLANMRDILKEELSGPRFERAMAVLEGANAESGKAGFLKRRMELDYKAVIPDGQGGYIRITDLFDSNVSTIIDRYLDGASAQMALARKGLRSTSDIDNLRQEFLHSVKDVAKRDEAAWLFDNTIARLQGRPVGERMSNIVRGTSAMGRMTALGMSSIWQVTEYATPIAKYGMLRATKHAIKELPVFRKLWGEVATDPSTSRRLQDILARQPEQDIRIRPYLDRFEDNFEIPQGSTFMLALQQAEHLVPYANMMKFVHGHQGRMVANLITDRLVQAAKGDAKASAALRKYGIESQVMDKVGNELRLHGTDTAKWSDGVLAELQPALSKMMDESVLHGRMGDVPAFAQFDSVGKFVFTYRSFVLNAHNKLLSGGLQRDGAVATAMLITYQLPLAMLAVRAADGIKGKDESNMQELALRALGQSGALGLFGELASVMSGEKDQFGAPGLIPIDRAYKLIGTAARGDAGGAATAAVDSMFLLNVNPAFNLLQNYATGD